MTDAARKRKKIQELRDKVELLESERDELKEQVKSLEQEWDAELREYVKALEAVKYWFHDTLYLGKPMTPPTRILRIVERMV